MILLTGIFVALLGLAFGSFLNVCIWRLPRHESVAAGRSHCPECGTLIRAMDNVPLLSFLVLRGRCRNCGAGISWRYPAIELATAALWLLCWLEFGVSVIGAGMAVFCFLALGLAAMDAEAMILPDAFTLPGIALGVIYRGAVCDGGWLARLRCGGVALGWAVCAAVIILGIRGLYWLVRRREGMGLGDAKLFAMLAAWLGPANAVLVLFLAVVAGALYGVFLSLRRVKCVSLAGPVDEQILPSVAKALHSVDGLKEARFATPGLVRVPLGAFLCAAAIYSAFGGQAAVDWYLGLFR